MCYLGRGRGGPGALPGRVTAVVPREENRAGLGSRYEKTGRWVPGSLLLNLAAVSGRGRLAAAGVENDFPIAVRLLTPHGHVAAAGGHRISVGVFAVTFKMPPG